MFVERQPFAVVEGDGADNASPFAIRGGEASILDRALGKDDLVAEGRDADRLDIDPEREKVIRDLVKDVTYTEEDAKEVRDQFLFEKQREILRDNSQDNS